ncbi:unnamed protein product (macronuclear) [Paramecium tetraurelia]|uniref:EamA domain-containing protein n=1 Tax=Paramecium tetraurelia TaxID=5888 RepID=A0E3T7_PARTE|nr:uncharacterized protein GSPATT00023127001 [Paramecium tetraurelia]CAK89954.1 unnamed protein product [Paramecium tetraurelia]|eukprot:XP_001457351.1 hypothetical protein (macronuclear) [Paramecium tetraurelia strain d4-2]
MVLNNFLGRLQTLEQQNIQHVSIGYMLAACFFHSLQFTVYKYAHFTIVTQALFCRAFLTLVLLFFGQYKQDFYPKDKVHILFFSQLLVAIGASFLFYGILYITTSEAAVINSTTAIWSQIISLIVNKEPLTKSRMINTLICIIGIVLIVNPKISQDNDMKRIMGCLSVLVCSIIQAAGFSRLKQIGKDVRPTITTFYFHIATIFVMSVQHQYVAVFEYFDYYFLYILGYALFSLSGHLLQFRAQTIVSYEKICNYQFSAMIYQIFMDYFIFGKILSIQGFLGGGLIVFGIFKQVQEDRKIR